MVGSGRRRVIGGAGGRRVVGGAGRRRVVGGAGRRWVVGGAGRRRGDRDPGTVASTRNGSLRDMPDDASGFCSAAGTFPTSQTSEERSALEELGDHLIALFKLSIPCSKVRPSRPWLLRRRRDVGWDGNARILRRRSDENPTPFSFALVIAEQQRLCEKF